MGHCRKITTPISRTHNSKLQRVCSGQHPTRGVQVLSRVLDCADVSFGVALLGIVHTPCPFVTTSMLCEESFAGLRRLARGKPPAFHSLTPIGSRNARKPCALNRDTASTAVTQ